MSLTPAMFPVMRGIGAKAQRHMDKHRSLMPRHGEIAVGGAHMDDFFLGNALEVFLRELRKDGNVGRAESVAKAEARESILKWNKHRGGDHVVHRWDGAADSAIEEAARRVRDLGVPPLV